MNAVLLSAGAIAILAAVLGGGLQAFDVSVPVITSRPRQVLLFLVGLGFLGSAWLLREQSGDGGVADYRAVVVASCDRIANEAKRPLPMDVYESPIDNTFRKDNLVAELRGRQNVIAAELDAALGRDVPESLRDEHGAARGAVDRWLARFTKRMADLAAIPKDVVAQRDADALTTPEDASIRVEVNGAMSALAGRNCDVSGG